MSHKVQQQAQALLDSFESTGQIEAEALAALAQDARDAAASLTPEQGAALFDIVQRVLRAATMAHEAQKDEISRVGDGRRALKGYGALRSSSRAQRLRKQV